MVSYFVLYRGRAADPESFVERYRTTHVPILATWPGIQRITLHTPIVWDDPHGVRSGDFALIAEMTFADEAALQQALASDARSAAREDFTRFPAFAGEIFHQAMRSQRLL